MSYEANEPIKAEEIRINQRLRVGEQTLTVVSVSLTKGSGEKVTVLCERADSDSIAERARDLPVAIIFNKDTVIQTVV